LLEGSDQPVHPRIELGKGDSLVTADKSLPIGVEKGISVNDVGKGSYAVTAKLFKDKITGHESLLTAGKQKTVVSRTAGTSAKWSRKQAHRLKGS
jgi:hypothetical protein